MKKLTLTLLFAVVAVAMQAATVYLKIDGTNVKKDATYAYAWNGGTKFLGNWPGTKMTDVQTFDETEYLVINIDTEGDYSLIFNNNSGAQTEDIEKLVGDYTFSYTGAQVNGKYTCNKTPGAPGSAPVTVSDVKIFGDNYGKWATGVAFTYDSDNDEYVYTESDPTKLGGEFKLSVDGNIHYSTDAYRNVALSTTSDFQELSDVNNMKLTDCSDFTSATLTVKKEGEKWLLKIVGKKETPVETHTVQILGEAYTWSFETAPKFAYNEETNEYVYVEETPANLAKNFKLGVDNTWRATETFKNVALASATTDFVAIPGDLGYGENMCLTDAADYKTITLTVKKIDGVWSMQILGEKENEEDENVVTMTGDNYADASAFTFDETNQLYTYTESDPSKLASFNVAVDGVNYGNAELTTVAGAADFVALSQSDAAIALTDVADYKNATLTVKKEGDVWMLMIAGEKKETPVETHVVKIKGKFNDWNLTELEGSDGIYTITVTENIVELADAAGFGFEIDGVYYAGDIELELDGDAVVMTANPNFKNVRLANDGKYDIILTVAKVGSDWTVQAATGNPSAVEAINAENVNVMAGNGEIVVEGAQCVAVYTVAGALVSTDARTRVAAGLYIVRADNVVKKVLVK